MERVGCLYKPTKVLPEEHYPKKHPQRQQNAERDP